MSLKWYTFKIHSGTLSRYYIQSGDFLDLTGMEFIFDSSFSDNS